MLGQQVEERRRFSKAERAKILERSGGKCLCCGKQLKPEDFTVDHVVPLSRGGTNDIENLVALCFNCNSFKSNDLYVPQSFYKNASEKLLKELNNHFDKWFDTVYKDYPVEVNPLVSPRSGYFFSPMTYEGMSTDFKHFKKIVKKRKRSPQFMFMCDFVDHDNAEEVEKASGVFIQNIVNDMHQLAFIDRTRKDPVAIYSFHSSTGKVILIMAVVVDLKYHRLMVYSPYQNSSSDILNTMTLEFLHELVTTVQFRLHQQLNQVLLFTDVNKYTGYFFVDVITLSDMLGLGTAPKQYAKYGELAQCLTVEPLEGQAPGMKNDISLQPLMLRIVDNDKDDPYNFHSAIKQIKHSFNNMDRTTKEDRQCRKELLSKSLKVDREHREKFEHSLRVAEKRYKKANAEKNVD